MNRISPKLPMRKDSLDLGPSCSTELPEPETRHDAQRPVPRGRQFVGAWREWSSGTTLHGIKFVFDQESLILRRVLWLIIISLCSWGLIALSLVQLGRFREYKTVTKSNVEFREAVPFPAVTICNHNKVRNDSVVDPDIRALLKHLFLTRPQHNTSLEAHYDKAFMDAIDFREIFDYNEADYGPNILYCSWMNQPVECGDVLKPVHTDYGACFTVQPDASSTGDFINRMVGSDSGLKLLLWTDQDNYFIGDMASAGFKVLVHDPDEEPAINQLSTTVGPGYTHYIAITRHEHKYLPHPVKAFGHSECQMTHAEDFENPLQFHDKYSYVGCVRECLARYINATCGCVFIFDPGNYTICHPLKLACRWSAITNFSTETGIRGCDCPLPCTILKYTTQVSSAYYPNSNLYDLLVTDGIKLNVTFEEWRRNGLQLRIYFESSLVHKQEQLLEYTRGDLVGDVGGYLGLALGASIITFVEMFERLFLSVYRCLRTHR